MKPDTPEQTAAIRSLEDRWKDRAVERATIKERYAQRMKEELAKADREVSRAMQRAKQTGLSKSRLGRLIGTADFRTINTFLDLTAEEFAVETISPVLQSDFTRYVVEVDHAKTLMKATLFVRGDGLEIRKTQRQVKFVYRSAATFADFNIYSAPLDEFDLDDLDLVREIRDDLQEQVPPGRAIRVVIRGLEDGPAMMPPVQQEDPLQYMTAADWDALRDDE